MDIDRQKLLIFERVGKENLKILRDSGIDIDSAVTEILTKRGDEQFLRELQVSSRTPDVSMTSELAYLSNSLEDSFGREYFRRLRLIGLPDDKIQSLYQHEQITAASPGLREHRRQSWVQRYFIMPDSTPQTLPKQEEMTLSELLLITDDANSAFWRDHEHLPKQAWQALCIAACCAQYTEAKYAKAFNDRTEKLGWLRPQNGAYVRNEFLLTERLKWGMHQNPAWTPETTDLKLYTR